MAGEDIEFVTFDGDVITKNDYRQELIDMYVESQYAGLTKVTDFTTGSEALHLADVIATFLLEHRENIDSNYRMSMIHTCEGEFLDNHGDMVGVHRYPSSPSVGVVRFTRNENVTGVISIPDGTIVSTPDAISFMVDLDGVEYAEIPANVNAIDLNVLCEQEGAYTNILPNTIDRVLDNSVLSGQVSVTNPTSFSEGADIESDDDYRNRILLAPFEAPTASVAWYNNVALTPRDENDNPTIHDVYVQKNSSGTYDISIYYNPVNRDDTVVVDNETVLRATRDIQDLFMQAEYDIAGINLELLLSSLENVLVSDTSATYYIAVLLETGYALDLLEDSIKAKVDEYNSTLQIGIEVMPSILASMVQEVEGVSVCKIVKEDTNNVYTECVEPISIPYNKVGFISSGLKDNIVLMNFNLEIEVDNS